MESVDGGDLGGAVGGADENDVRGVRSASPFFFTSDPHFPATISAFLSDISS